MISIDQLYDDSDLIGQAFADQFGLTRQPVQYIFDTDLAFCSREPCRSLARTLTIGQHVALHYLSPKQSLAVGTEPDAIVGYLYASDAALLSILYDYYLTNPGNDRCPELVDHSQIRTILTGPPPDRPEARRLRYPKVGIRICLELRHAWPLFVILSVLHLKDESEAPCVSSQDNPWLKPYVKLRKEYRDRQYDAFSLPALLAEKWMDLTA